jgi:hypothetical protein
MKHESAILVSNIRNVNINLNAEIGQVEFKDCMNIFFIFFSFGLCCYELEKATFCVVDVECGEIYLFFFI